MAEVYANLIRRGGGKPSSRCLSTCGKKSRPFSRRTATHEPPAGICLKNITEKGIMAVIYATLIVKGKKTLDQVPALIRKQVEEILKDLEVEVE